MSFGERLRLARRMARLSGTALGEKVGVSRQAISKYELGKDMPRSGVLARLARALNVRPDFFLRVGPAVGIQKCAFRKRTRLAAAERRALEAKVRDWLERYLEVESFLPPEEQHSFRVPAKVRRSVRSLDDVERAAKGLRVEWQLGLGPVQGLTELLEGRGLPVVTVDAHADFSAMALTGDGRPLAIAVNQNHPGDRQRFSLAHELGHLVLRPSGNVREEPLTNRFASAFLVPAATARQELGGTRRSLALRELYLLKHRYGMSMQAWVHRAADLGLLTQAGARQLYKAFSTRGWREREPGDQVEPETPKRMERLVARLLSEGLVSESRAAELLGMSLRDFHDELLESYRATGTGG